LRTAVEHLARRFCTEERGQDLIEYAILTAIVTVASLVVFLSIRTRMAAVYLSWGTSIHANWQPPPPMGP
jgi:Flp pilus assembly pilin Flp